MRLKDIIPLECYLVPPFIVDTLSDVPKKLRGYVVKPVRDKSIDPKINRNSICPCGSGKKFKNCCI